MVQAKITPIDTPVQQTASSHVQLTANSSMRPTETFPEFNFVFSFSHFIQKYRINRFFQYVPFRIFRALSVIIGYTQAQKGHNTVLKTWNFLFPKRILENVNLKRWTNSYIQYNIELWFDTTFYLTCRNSENHDFFNPIEGFNHLEKALRQKKGVLIPVIHFGEFLHTLYSLFHRRIIIDDEPQKILVLALGSKENEYLLRESYKSIDNFNIIVTNDFSELKQTMKEYLKQNYVVFLAHDYFSKKQLRTPFIYNSRRYNFSIPSPQMISHLHLNTGAPIIPVVALPRHNLKHSLVKFFPEVNPMTMKLSSESKTLQKEILNFRRGNLTKKQKYGLLSLLINRELYPNLLRHPFLWQGAFLFFERTQFQIHLNDIQSYKQLLEEILPKLNLYINKTYEPGRKDDKILQEIQRLSNDLEKITIEPREKLQINNKFIELGRLNGRAVISKTISIIKSFQNSYIKLKYKKINEKLDSLRNFF
ncbi:MAG: LpxL/LpxP family acyltransferase [Promethearchaeota archaeon]